jgi:predicted PurR-regulated permease PerM
VFVAGFTAVVLVMLWFASHIPRTITVFIIAAFIAFGVQPLVVKLQQRRIPRPFAIAIVFALLLLVIAIGLVIIVPMTIAQTQALAVNAPSYALSVQGWLTSGESWLRDRFPNSTLSSNVFDVGQLGGAKIASLATTTLASLGTILITAATAFFVGFSALILSFFFLANDHQIAEGFAALFPESRRATARRLSIEITELFGGYISGQVIVSAITGLVVAVLSALLGFKFSLILGIITAVAYAIPIFGMLVAQLIALVLCAPQGVWMVVWVQVIMFGMARISDNILVPKIMGDSVGVSPIGVMFAVFAGGELFGLPGLILGIPAAALIKILWRAFVAPWLHAQLEDKTI